MEPSNKTRSRTASSPARSWPLALGLAAAALYLPQLLPLVATDLLDHSHCLATYARLFPVLCGVVSGLSARIASDIGEPWEEFVFVGVAALVTLVLLAGTTVALRRWKRRGIVVALATALVAAVFSMAAVAIIRA